MEYKIIEATKYFFSDKAYILITGYIKTRRIANLKNPKTFYDKMQYLKINNRFKEYSQYVDKYKVREFVSKEIGEKYLVPLLGVYSNFDEIDFELLPEKFVLMTNHSCGRNFICRNKEDINKKKIKKQFTKWLKEDFYYRFREIQYKDIKPLIICEEYLQDKSGGLIDYKFICSNGEPKYIQIDIDRYNAHKQKYYDLDWKELNWSYGFDKYNGEIEKPKNLNEMIEIAKKLSSRFQFVRVDLYSVENRIYFGELTFSPGAGLLIFNPEEINEIVGNYINMHL
ncbi:ATP-grasp fold amidoligase family protein [uncultured Clostridium sp.]|uniref:ATP-grasp fold amidoligase family protein n=1 Tax=uncultured Clostridium sp. TaxID=59620 RepID=UPI00258B3B4B|nr:ATP-grasp fold amidoligase family protein [uncultured Clostridium sp.]